MVRNATAGICIHVVDDSPNELMLQSFPILWITDYCLSFTKKI